MPEWWWLSLSAFIGGFASAVYSDRKKRREINLAVAAARLLERNRCANAAWEAINNAMPDGSWHDVQEIVNTAIRRGDE